MRIFALPRRSRLLAGEAMLLLLVGWSYYWLFRGSVGWFDPSYGSFPSLVHMVALCWLALALLGIGRGVVLAVLLLAVSLAAEYRFGTLAALDVWMLLAGAALGCYSARRWLKTQSEPALRLNPLLPGSVLLLLCAGLVRGSYCVFCVGDGFDDRNAKPVYMDYQTLRSAVAVSSPRPLVDVSRVYVYQSAVFLVNPNNGIHVLDNSDPASPVNAAFIEVPGNTELSIRDNYLYADSYIDLVTLDISDPSNVVEVARQEDIFPYDEYQNVPRDIYFGYNDIDQSRGVVVGYENID